MILIGGKSSLLKHVVLFRWLFYMILKDNVRELDLTLNFHHEDFSYVIFATTNTMKCYGCGENGHIVRDCPRKVDKINTIAETTDDAFAGGKIGGICKM